MTYREKAMEGALGYYAFMFLPPLLIAFLLQLLAGSRRRGRPTILIGLGWTVAASLMLRSGGDWLGMIVSLGFLLLIGLVLALAGAFIGIELATLVRRLFRRPVR